MNVMGNINEASADKGGSEVTKEARTARDFKDLDTEGTKEMVSLFDRRSV